MKQLLLISAAIGLVLIGSQCTYHNAEEYFNTPNTDLCDTTNMSFSTNVTPILESNCYACHNSVDQTAGITLDNYEGVKSAASQGLLLPVIKHEDGYPAMPLYSAQLDSCSINQIEAWVNQGMLNN